MPPPPIVAKPPVSSGTTGAGTAVGSGIGVGGGGGTTVAVGTGAGTAVAGGLTWAGVQFVLAEWDAPMRIGG